jgi:hypothetical protein
VKINSDSENAVQLRPSIAVNWEGKIYCMWQDRRNDILGSNHDIYYAMSLSGKTWTDPNVKINDEMSISNQNNPSIVVDSQGTVYMVWEDYRNADKFYWQDTFYYTDIDIFFSRSSDGGRTWTDPDTMVNDAIPYTYQMNPALAIDNAGILYAVWEDNRGYNRDIYLSRSLDGGETWSPDIIVNDNTEAWAENPDIAVDPQGIIYVVWDDTREDAFDRQAQSDIFIARSADGGLSWSENFRVNTYYHGLQHEPSLDVDLQGILYVSWTDLRNGYGDSDIYFAKSLEMGISWSTEVRVNTDIQTANQIQSDLDVDDFGNVYIAWADNRLAQGQYDYRYDIYVGRSSNGGKTWMGPDIRVNTDWDRVYQINPAMVVDRLGDVQVTWEDYRSSSTLGDIYYARSQDRGRTWTHPNLRVNDDLAFTVQREPDLGVDDSGKVYVAWEDFRDDFEITYSVNLNYDRTSNIYFASGEF